MRCKKSLTHLFSLLLFLCLATFNQAQGQNNGATQSLQEEEDSLLSIAPRVISSTSDSAKFAAADALMQQLQEVLSNPASFDYEFANLRMSTVAIASHPKADVKLFTFNIILKNGFFTNMASYNSKPKRASHCTHFTIRRKIYPGTLKRQP